VTDGTAAVISAAVKAVVRNSFMRLSYTLSPCTVIKEQVIWNIVPARILDRRRTRTPAPHNQARRGAADRGEYRQAAGAIAEAMTLEPMRAA